MLEVYSEMTPDAFRTQLQTVLTAYYEDIKGIVCASGCTKSKVVKRKFEDHDDIPAPEPAPDPAPAPAHAPDDDAAAAADPPASPPDGRSPAGRAQPLRGRFCSGPQPCGQGRQGEASW